jgi:hypothetical protein
MRLCCALAMPTRMMCVGKIAGDASANCPSWTRDFAHPTHKGAAVGFMGEGP